MEREPIRVAVYIAALVTGLGTFFITWAQTADWKLAAGSGLLAVVVPIGGAEVARRAAYAPDTVQKLTGLSKAELDARVARLQMAEQGKLYRPDAGQVNLTTVVTVLVIILLVVVILAVVGDVNIGVGD